MSYKRLAYGRPKDLPGYGRASNDLMNLVVRWHQVSKFRPPLVGYKAGRR